MLRQCKVERKHFKSNRSSDIGAGDWEVNPFQPSVAFHIETSHLRHSRTHVSGSSYRIKSSQITTYLESYFVTAVGLQVMLPSKSQPHKMVKHTQTIRRLMPTNCLSVFDHFVGLALKGFTKAQWLTCFVPLFSFISTVLYSATLDRKYRTAFKKGECWH